jgi:hypothetical protein
MAILGRMFLGAARPQRWRRLARDWLVLCALQLAGNLDLPAQTQTTISKDYQVKAAFLFKFSQFVEWPDNTFPDKETPLTIGVLGDDPFKGFLSELVRDEKVGSRPLRVEYYRRVEEVKGCHILFVSSSEGKGLGQILAALKNRSILTVGESDGFAQSGGMIRFVISGDRKVRFRINATAAKDANLTISAKLLRLADVPPPPKG